MNAFIIELADKPGELAKVTEAIAQKGIDITGFAGVTIGTAGAVVLITNDESGTRSALSSVGVKAREAELVMVGIEPKPGALAKVARKLADAGINVEAALPTGMSGDTVHVAIATGDPAKARQVLGEKVMTGAMG